MPELRRGVRRGRARVTQKRSSSPPLQNYVKTRAAVAREAAKALARPKPRLAARKKLKEEEENQVILISEEEGESDSERREEEEKLEEVEEEEEEKVAMGDDSGGLSANKAAGKEDETVPFPEKVCVVLLFLLF